MERDRERNDAVTTILTWICAAIVVLMAILMMLTAAHDAVDAKTMEFTCNPGSAYTIKECP